MAIRTILLYGAPVLRTPAAEVVDFGPALGRLVRDMTDTMLDAPGVGLAAPQIGAGLRVLTFHVDGQLGHLVNPVLSAHTGTDTDEEGCLSIPDVWGPVTRPATVVATGLDVQGRPQRIEAAGLLARCLQHEVDHLDGILFFDRMAPEDRRLAKKQILLAPWNRRDLARPAPGAGLDEFPLAAGERR